MTTKARWTGRRLAGLATIGAVVLVAGAVSGAGAASGVQLTAATLAYTCTFPSGAQPVSVQVAATFPAAGTAGRPIQPTAVSVAASLPTAAISDLTSLGTVSLTATASLIMTVTQNGRSSPAAWSGLAVPSTPIPATGNLVLTASGPVPSVTVADSGDVTFTPAGLSLVLTPRRSDGTATTPPTLTVPCTQNGGQTALLGRVPVPDAATPPAGTSTPGRPAPGGPVIGAPPPKATAPPAVRPDTTGFLFGYLAGRSDVAKLNGASLVGPAPLTVMLTGQIKIVNGELHSYDEAWLYVPPIKSTTFLTFGFMPTTATMQLFPVPGSFVTLDTASPLKPPFTPHTTATSEMYARIYDASVNGTPLAVGGQCETVTPIHITLQSESDYKGVQQGGHLSGVITIPPFTHCGVSENLDSLFDASISGPGNYMRMQQGSLCVLVHASTGNCKPGVPTP